MKALLGTKIGMVQITKDNGDVIPVTLLESAPGTVTQVRTEEVDGYSAIQVGYGEDKKAGKSKVGHVKKSKSTPKHLTEFRASEIDLKVGDKIDVTNFEIGDKVKVTGTSKGKGFAGTVKRHNFNTGPKSHGSKNVRRPGSIGSMYPQNVYKGRKMAGQMGNEKVSTLNVEVAFIDEKKNLIGLKGAVPGPRNGLVKVRGNA